MKITWLPTIVCLFYSSWNLPVNAFGRKICVNNRCVMAKIDFSVTSTGGSVKFQWTSPLSSLFGYCIRYKCNSDDEDVNYCTDGREKCTNVGSKSQRHEYSYTDLHLSHNATTCWFWIAEKGMNDYCSEVVHCNISSPIEVSKGPSSSTLMLTSTALSLPSTTDKLSPSTSTVAPSVTMPSMITSSKFRSSSSTIVLTTLSTSSMVTSSQSLSISSMITSSQSLSTSSMVTSSQSLSTSSSQPSLTIVTSSTSVISPSQSSTPPSGLSLSSLSSPSISSLSSSSSIKRKISLHLMVLLSFLSVAVLAMLLMSVVILVYWKRDKLKKFDDLTKNKIEQYCDYNDDVAKDNNSDLEYVEPDGKDDDVCTINEDTLYMLEQISHKQNDMIRWLSSHCSGLSDDSGSVPDHYYGSNNGSAGHCSSLNNITIEYGSAVSSDDDSI